MLNPKAFFNSRSDGFGVLEIADDTAERNASRQFVPLKRTDLTGTVTGPLGTLSLAQTFSLSEPRDAVIEALYRFPLPGDAAVLGVRVQFGDVKIQTTLKEREKAEAEYKEAKRTGRQAALVTRESPDVFTLAVAGIRAGQDVVVRTEYVQLARSEGAGWSLRVPLTTAPRYVRGDESNSPHAAGQPLAILRDPGHRFALDVKFLDADRITSQTHSLAIESDRVRLRDGDVLPDRDCVISWQPMRSDRPTLRVWTHADAADGNEYFLALCAPSKVAPAKPVPREVILLVDHSGSMEGAKWEATDWAVERFLAGLGERDSFALGLFHDTTTWFVERPQKATPDALRQAIQFLKTNRTSGGTELGVALEQALGRARVADTPSRHVLVLTDAEVSDAGRILRLAENESNKTDRRRVSVLCIDSAPNAVLASELAERGGGVSRFLTSNPDEDDVTTALDEVLADWSAPVLTGLSLEVDRTGAEVCGRTVATIVPGPASGIDVGDLPAGRPVWVVGRVPSGNGPVLYRLRTPTEVVAEVRAEANAGGVGLKAFFGADRIRRLECVMHANYAGEELRAELARLGYETASIGEAKIYAENARDASAKVVRELLVRESLSVGVPCSETAFVAVRSEVGQVVTDTQIVANGLPHGWSERFADLGSRLQGIIGAPLGAMLSSAFSAKALDDESVNSMLMANDGDAAMEDVPPVRSIQKRSIVRPMLSSSRLLSGLSRLENVAPVVSDLRISVAAKQHTPADGAVLFDSATGDAGQFTFLSVAFADGAITVESLDSELTVLLFVGDLAAPRARVRLADVLRQGGRRPLNLRRTVGQPVRLILADPSGTWSSGVPAMEFVLGWKP